MGPGNEAHEASYITYMHNKHGVYVRSDSARHDAHAYS